MALALLFFAVCLLASGAGAISGIGGGVIIKPVLDAVSDLGVAKISFMSGCTVLSMSIVSLLRSRGGPARLELRRGTALAIGGAIGGVAGKQLFDMALGSFPNQSLVGGVQSAVLGLLTILVFVYVRQKHRIQPHSLQGIVPVGATGLALGLISSFLGIGGGPVNIMAISFLLGMDSKTAALHSLYVIFFSQTASLLLTLASGGVATLFTPSLLVVMILGGILGALIGSHLSRKLTNQHVDKLFSVVLVVVLALCVYNFIGFIA